MDNASLWNTAGGQVPTSETWGLEGLGSKFRVGHVMLLELPFCFQDRVFKLRSSVYVAEKNKSSNEDNGGTKSFKRTCVQLCGEQVIKKHGV